MISKILFSLILSTFKEQNIFFLETYNASTISEPKFTVWSLNSETPCMIKILCQSIDVLEKDNFALMNDKTKNIIRCVINMFNNFDHSR